MSTASTRLGADGIHRAQDGQKDQGDPYAYPGSHPVPGGGRRRIQYPERGATAWTSSSLQEALIELGFLTGKADGNFGAATEKAVIAFQQKNKYPDTGLVDANLQAFLYSGKPVNAKGTATAIKTLSPVPGVTMKLNNTGALVGELQHQAEGPGVLHGEITKNMIRPQRAPWRPSRRRTA